MRIGRYDILGRLGRGGMGGVYKVRHRELGRIMAMKVLQPQDLLEMLMGEDAVREAFVREARLLGACDNPNIASVWDLGEDDGRLYMVLEYLCMNLGSLIGEGHVMEAPTRPMPRRKALSCVRQALRGLDFLHRRGVIHLDVKPGNLMLGSDGSVKLIDLGLSRIMGEQWSRPKGLKIGTPWYCPPEQEDRPELADARSDLYALAAVLFRLISGRVPEPDAWSAMQDDPWLSFFDRALARRPDDRFQDADAMDHALARLERQLPAASDDCVLPEAVCPSMFRLRSRPIRTGVREQPFDFLDDLFRPLLYHDTVLEPVADGWFDPCVGLVWGGISTWPMTFEDAHAHVAALGPGWRLPTVEELVSLLRPGTGLDDFCNRPFGDRYLWVWTADRRSYTAAWFVDVGGGAVLAQDMSCRFHVRPVRQA